MFSDKLRWFILSSISQCTMGGNYASVNSKPDHPPPRATPRDSHILVAPGVGFSFLCLARGSAPWGVLNQSNFEKFLIILKKTRFLLSLKQMSSSSFHMFIHDRSDLGPIYNITNMQRIRIYPGKLKSILVKISPDPGR